MTRSAAQARTICKSAIQGNDSTARRAIRCMTSGFWPVSKPTSSSLLPRMMVPSGVWRMLPSGIGQARVVRSVDQDLAALRPHRRAEPETGASLALPSPAASTTIGAPIVSSPKEMRKSRGATVASVTVRFGR